MDETRRGWLKALLAIPAMVVGSKLLPEEVKPVVKVEPKEELPMVRQGVQTLDHLKAYQSYTLTTVVGEYEGITETVYQWRRDG